jgi:hypothetical protein
MISFQPRWKATVRCMADAPRRPRTRGALALPARRLGVAAIVAATALAVGGVGALNAHASAPRNGFPSVHGFTDRVVFDGAQLEHAIPGGSEHLSDPDDITLLDGRIFVGFQNGVGPQGQASPTGNVNSTVVELDLDGHTLEQWDITGKCDGLTADPATGSVIATVNEDANSSLYTIDPASATIVRYHYSEPLPSYGGTDAISLYDGMVLVSASAPGTTGAPAPQASYPAVYRVALNASTGVAAISSLFGDEATATDANFGSGGGSVTLMLTDPDSNEDVPFYAPRFAGDFMLTSQGDQEQIFVSDAGGSHQALSVLHLSSSVDDTAWPTPGGALYVTDNAGDTVTRISGPFRAGSVFVADTPCDENSAPSTCPGPGYPPNYLGQLNPLNGTIALVPLLGPAVQPQGMLFVPAAPGGHRAP